MLSAEAHVAALDRHVELAEQPAEMRVGGVVEDDEAGIDRLVAAAPGHDGAGVAAEPRLGLEERHRGAWAAGASAAARPEMPPPITAMR